MIMVIGYLDTMDRELVGLKIHKIRTIGEGKLHWYPFIKISDYKREKALYICEGEKDVITLLSHHYQAISGTAGAMSIPKDKDGNYDLEWLGIFIVIYICYDNDDSGYKGAKKLAAEILKQHPHQDIKIIQWDSGLPKGFDVTDSFEKDEGLDFHNGVKNCMKEEPEQKEEQYEGFETMTLDKFIEAEFEPQYPLIDNIMDKGSISLIAGDEGTGKSWAILSSALSLASGVPLFDFFKIHSSKGDGDSE